MQLTSLTWEEEIIGLWGGLRHVQERGWYLLRVIFRALKRKKKSIVASAYCVQVASPCHKGGIKICSFMNVRAALLYEGVYLDMPWIFATLTVV